MFEAIFDILAATNALLFLIGGGIVSGIGLLMLGYLAYVRLFERRYQGEVVGIRTNKPGGKMYYPLIGYTDENGTRHEVFSNGGASALMGMTPGTKVTIYVGSMDADAAILRAHWWAMLIIGSVILASGAPFLAIGFETLRWTPGTAIAVIALAAYFGWKFYEGSAPAVIAMRKGWKPGREALAAKRKRKSEKKKSKRAVVVTDAEIAAAVEREAKQASFARPMVMAVGIALLIGGAFWFQSTTAFVRVALVAEGTVVGNEASGSGDDVTYHAVVRFTDEHGRRITYEDSIGSSPPMHRSGDNVRVLYSPADSKSAMIDRGLWNWLVPLVIAAAGALMFLATAWSAFKRLASMQAASSASSPSPQREHIPVRHDA